MIPESWPSEYNERMLREDVPHVSRPFRALMEWAKETGSVFDLLSPETEPVFKWSMRTRRRMPMKYSRPLLALSTLTQHFGLSEAGIRSDIVKKFSHNLARPGGAVVQGDSGSEIAKIKDRFDVFPPVAERYDGAEYPVPRLWLAYSVSQMACTAAIRSITGRDIRRSESFRIVWPQASNPPI